MNCHEQTSTPWTGELIFTSSINNNPCKDQNILQFVDSKNHKQTKKRNIYCFKVYLNPEKYPSQQGYNSVSFNNLSKDLSSASISCSFNLVKNGTREWKSNNIKMIRFVCCRYRKFRGNTRSVDDSEYNFRRHDFHNNKKNSRGKEGVHCQRKTWAKRAMNLEHTCPFYFYIAYDTKGFLLFQAWVLKNIIATTNILIRKSLIYLNLDVNCLYRMKKMLQIWVEGNYLQPRHKQQFFKAVET